MFIKIENNIVTQKQPNQEDGFLEVDFDVICGMEHDGGDVFDEGSFSMPAGDDPTWMNVSALQNSMIDDVMWRVVRYQTQDILGVVPNETPEKYLELLQYMQDIRDNDEDLHATPDEALAALQSLVKP